MTDFRFRGQTVHIVSRGGEPVALLDDADTTGDGVEWAGGKGALIVNGTWDTADASLEWSADDVTWWALGSAYALSDDGLVLFDLPEGYIRVAIANAGTTELSAIVRPI